MFGFKKNSNGVSGSGWHIYSTPPVLLSPSPCPWCQIFEINPLEPEGSLIIILNTVLPAAMDWLQWSQKLKTIWSLWESLILSFSIRSSVQVSSQSFWIWGYQAFHHITSWLLKSLNRLSRLDSLYGMFLKCGCSCLNKHSAGPGNIYVEIFCVWNPHTQHPLPTSSMGKPGTQKPNWNWLKAYSQSW